MVAPLFQHLKSIQVELIFRGLRDFNFSLPCKQEKLKGESTNQPARPRPQKGIAFPLSLPVSPHSRSSCAFPSSFLLSPFVFVRCERARRSSAPLPAAIGILISSYTSSSSSSFCGFARLPPFPSTKQCCNQPGFTQQYDHHRCAITPPPPSRQSCFIMTGLDVEKVESSI